MKPQRMQTEAGAYGWALNITAPALIYPCLDVREGEAPAEPRSLLGSRLSGSFALPEMGILFLSHSLVKRAQNQKR